MPVEIVRETKYTVDLKVPSLQFEKNCTMDEAQIAQLYKEWNEVGETLAAIRSQIQLPSQKRQYSKLRANEGREKLLAYAKEHDDFTIKNAAEATGCAENSLYTIAAKLIEEGVLKREQVGKGLAHIYSLIKKP